MNLTDPAATTVPSLLVRALQCTSRQARPVAGELLYRWYQRPLPALFVITLCAAAHAGEPDDGPVLQFGDRKQLLVDDHVIAGKHLLVRRLGRPMKMDGGQPIIVDDTPWEDFGVPIVGSVLREDGRFRIWYRAAGSGQDSATYCYADSRDGVRTVPRTTCIVCDSAAEI